MSYECFEVEIVERVAHVRMSRPDELNTMTPAFWRELPEIVGGISDDGSARVVVLSSTGRHFTAGMHLSVFASGPGGGPDPHPNDRTNMRLAALAFQSSFTTLETARMPVLAAVQGGCIGGGVDLVSACDLRYCTADAWFCIHEINIGMTADVGTLQRLPKIIPEGIVREYAYTGRRMPAERAYEVGLVNGVFDDQPALLDGVMEVAAEIAAKSPLAIWGSKDSITYARDHAVADGLDRIAVWQTGMLSPTELGEAIRAQTDKRSPSFEDLPPYSPPWRR